MKTYKGQKAAETAAMVFGIAAILLMAVFGVIFLVSGG